MTGARPRAAAFTIGAATSFALAACGAFGTSKDEPAADAAVSDADSAVVDADADASSGDAGKEDAAPSGPDRYIFTTSSVYAALGIAAGGGGNTGVAAADYICNGVAKVSGNTAIKNRGQSGSFKAWLGTAATPAKSRIAADENRRIKRADEQIVASSWSAFTASTHSLALDKDQAGQQLPDLSPVWTNADVDGSFVGGNTDKNSCTNWSQAQGNAIFGDPHATTQAKEWTNAGSRDCSLSAHFYCIEN